MTIAATPDLARLEARAALHDLQMAYCRGVDRADGAILATIFHEDATVDAGMFKGSADDFVKMIGDVVRGFKSSFHSIANEYYDIAGDEATGESYVIAHVLTATPYGDREMMTGGRYLDRYSRRDGTWKIAARLFVADWTTNHPSTSQRDVLYADTANRGTVYPDDPLYRFLAAG